MADTYTPAWVEVLKRAGYPTDVLVIDFETYFDESYSMGRKADSLSTIEYVTDPRFETVSCTFTQMTAEYPFAAYDAHTLFVAKEESVAAHIRYLQDRYGQNFESATVVAQNARFDLTVLAKHHGIFPKFFIDTLGLARHLNSRQHNDLGTLCTQYSLPPKGDTSQFNGLTFRTRVAKPKKKGPQLPLPRPKFTDIQVEALAAYNVNDNLREWELFTIMLPQISNPATELRIMQLTIEMFTQPMLRVNFAKGEELVRQFNEQIDKTIGAVQLSDDLRYKAVLQGEPLGREHISGNNSFEGLMLTAIELAGENALAYTKFGKPNKDGSPKAMLALAKSDDERDVLLNHPDPTIRALMQARAAIKSWPNHISRVERIMAQAKANDGILPVPLNYHGAHTGRDSGSEKINLQNLGSRGDPLITAIRNMLETQPGYTLLIVDAAQVEARGCDWIAGQADSVERWALNQDQYSIFASSVVGYTVRKPTTFDPPTIAKRLKWARDSIGKVGVLGCQFGMGGDKAEGYAQGAIDNATAHKIVETYRSTHAQVVQFWRDVERAFVHTARYHRPCSMPRGLRFDPYNEVGVIITLPNGRELHYPRVKLVAGAYGRDTAEVYNALEHKWEYTWGGTLTENIVQAFCRDILMETMLRLHDLGHRTAHRVHDELVIPVPDDQGEALLKIAHAEMSRTPVWAPGLPLGADVKLSKFYCK